MKAAELMKELSRVPADTEVLVWDMGQGGLVTIGELTWLPHEKSVTLEPKQEEAA